MPHTTHAYGFEAKVGGFAGGMKEGQRQSLATACSGRTINIFFVVAGSSAPLVEGVMRLRASANLRCS